MFDVKLIIFLYKYVFFGNSGIFRYKIFVLFFFSRYIEFRFKFIALFPGNSVSTFQGINTLFVPRMHFYSFVTTFLLFWYNNKDFWKYSFYNLTYFETSIIDDIYYQHQPKILKSIEYGQDIAWKLCVSKFSCYNKKINTVNTVFNDLS